MRAPHVSIVLSDRSWVLERLGTEIQGRVENVALNDAADPSADINYYITFACRKAPMPTLEMGFFAHMEQTPDLQRLFFDTARELDLCVCMSATYSTLLTANGIDTVVTIPPGVDHDRFVPKLRIGVVGRAYHTGRKGEGLVAQLMDMEGIDWHFTGTGWPKPGLHLPDEALPDFYRSMDYILVPALYEGGPMCVPEALAVGTPVIASNVGWVPDFPHIPFRNGDAADLRRVLEGLLDAKRKLSASTESYSWDNFAAAHDRAFHDLMARADKARNARGVTPPFRQPVRLLMHGNEHSTLGGPSVRVPKTAEALQRIGVPARVATFRQVSDIPEDVVHLFNVWNPKSALSAMQRLKAAGKTVVFSPIYLDLGERDFWQTGLAALPLEDSAALRQAHAAAKAHQAGRGRLPEVVPGYNAMVGRMVALADHVIFLSEAERRALAGIGVRVEDGRASLVRNPVDATLWQQGDPELFRTAWLEGLKGPQDYVLCIGRIEARKNQLLLARALRDMDLRLVLVGHEGDPAYAARIRAEGGDRVLMTGRMEAAGEMLRSALAGAKAFILPSWCEGASLAALEAAAAGATLVLSDRSSEREYFGDLAHYCDPGDPDSIRAAIETALALPDPEARAARLRAHVAAQNSWERHALDSARAYARAAAQSRPPVETAQAPCARPKLVFDITTLAHHKGRITGISRVESMLAREFRDAGAQVTFICWNDSLRHFIEVPARFAELHQALKYCRRLDDAQDAEPVVLTPECTILVAGSAWMQNSRYVLGLETLKLQSGSGLIAVIYDLVPFRFPFWFDPDYAPRFRENFHRLAAISDHILTDSRSCAADVVTVLQEAGAEPCPVTPIRLGDPVLEAGAALAEGATHPLRERLGDRKFILAVGAIHIRKNYDLLYRIWARFADENRHRDLHLVIVGGTAWNGQPLADRIAGDNRVNRHIHVLSGIEDADLAWLYEQCLFTVFPSPYEGWGLPVAESLVQGKLCLATSASSVPEIAPDFVEHIDPEDFMAWMQKISFYASSMTARAAREEAIRSGYRPVPWSRTATEILETVRQPRIRRGLRPVLAGEIAGAGLQTPALTIGFSADWHMAEGWGRWAASRNSAVEINTRHLWRPGLDHICLLVRQRAHFSKPSARPYSVRAGGKLLFASLIRNKGFPQEMILAIPATAVDATGVLRLDFDFPTAPDKPPSARSLGLGLESLTLLDPDHSNPLQSLSQTECWIDGSGAAHLDFALAEHRAAVAGGLHWSAAWGLGTELGRFDLLIPILPDAGAQDMTIRCRPVATSASPVELSVSWNGQAIGTFRLCDDQPAELRLSLPAELVARSAPSVLGIATDAILSPQDLGIGTDNTIVGLGITDILLTAKEAKA